MIACQFSAYTEYFLNNLHTNRLICLTCFPVLYLQHSLTYSAKTCQVHSSVYVNNKNSTLKIAPKCSFPK